MFSELKELIENIEKGNLELQDLENIDSTIINKLKTKNIIIYPAGNSARFLYNSLKKNNIKVDYFIDRAYEDIYEIDGVKVYGIDKLSKIDNTYVVIIASNLLTQYNNFEKNILKINKQINILSGKGLNRILMNNSCINNLKRNMTFDLFQCEKCGFERDYCPISMAYLKKIGKYKKIEEDWRSEKFDWFGCIISKNCTLKCEHCCEQVPYQKDKSFLDIDIILSDVQKIAKSSKFLKYVELIGGEPFLHPQIDELLTKLLEIENIGYIKCFTNATVNPSDKLCKIMQNNRFMLQISNYEKVVNEKLLNNIKKTKQKLKEFNINYIPTINAEWYDISSFELQSNDLNTVKNGFKNCFINICHRVYKGKLYRCPHQYTGIQLEKLVEYFPEVVNIHSLKEIELAEALNKFEELEYIEACKHCSMPIGANIVPAGKQL